MSCFSAFHWRRPGTIRVQLLHMSVMYSCVGQVTSVLVDDILVFHFLWWVVPSYTCMKACLCVAASSTGKGSSCLTRLLSKSHALSRGRFFYLFVICQGSYIFQKDGRFFCPDVAVPPLGLFLSKIPQCPEESSWESLISQAWSASYIITIVYVSQNIVNACVHVRTLTLQVMFTTLCELG